MPNVTAFQKADRLALMGGMHDFFDALSELPMSWDATRVALIIRRCEYEGKPADVKTLNLCSVGRRRKCSSELKELEQYGFEFQTVREGRRSVQRLYGRETRRRHSSSRGAPTSLTRWSWRAKRPKRGARTPTSCLPQPEQPKARFGWKRMVGSAAAAFMAAWLVFDTDKVDDLNWEVSCVRGIDRSSA